VVFDVIKEDKGIPFGAESELFDEFVSLFIRYDPFQFINVFLFFDELLLFVIIFKNYAIYAKF
jgi:hypothetical protein